MSSSDPANDLPLNSYAADWGSVLTSTFLACTIFGITVLQSFYYYNTYKRDRITWKILVFVIMAMDMAALGLVMYCMQYYLVLSWGIPEQAMIDVKPFPTEYVITSFLVTIVQGFYINTIRALRAPLVVTIFLSLLSLTALATGLILPHIQLTLKLIPIIVVYPLNHSAFNVARGTALACDLGIVVALCWLLGRRKSEVRRANNMINALIAFSVERGVLQAIVQAGEVLSYAIKPAGIYFLPFHIIVSRIYCTSLLATLNTREYVAKVGLPTLERDDVRDPSHITFAANENREGSTFAGATRPVISSYFDPPFLYASADEDANRDLESRGQGSKGSGNALKLDLGRSRKSMDVRKEQEIQLSSMPRLALQPPSQLSKEDDGVSPTRSTMSDASEGCVIEVGEEMKSDL